MFVDVIVLEKLRENSERNWCCEWSI